MKIEFEGQIWYWKGPAPHHFVTVPEEESNQLKSIQGLVTYGWGMIPVTVKVNKTEWTTSLWPKDGQFIVPIKAHVRSAEGIDLNSKVTLSLEVSVNPF